MLHDPFLVALFTRWCPGQHLRLFSIMFPPAHITALMHGRHRRYLYRADPASDYDGDEKHWAELWAFAAAILPRVNECSADVAATLRANSDIASDAAPMSAGFVAVKEALESIYSCLGMTCEQVKLLQTAGTLVVYSQLLDRQRRQVLRVLGTRYGRRPRYPNKKAIAA